ncbi:MAG TPA: carotenoid 1,2-hydratase [Polyangiaceae bacterium]|nr:carotenoid 1,2-hydratase [Polyangiaceae bacterium]
MRRGPAALALAAEPGREAGDAGALRPRFDEAVADRGYGWFYLDGVSDDGACAVVLILMLGNVFSPRWARARAAGLPARSLDFSAVNVAVHGPGRSRWAMTERGAAALARSRDELRIGASGLAWDGDELVARVDERSAPWGARVAGAIRFRPEVRTAAAVALDAGGRHVWRPHAPFGRIEVDFREPALRFRGHGYFDANAGCEPLEEAFSSWTWSRFATRDAIALAYDVTLRGGGAHARGVKVSRHGEASPLGPGPSTDLGPTRFRLGRPARGEAGARVSLVRTLEDGPFYARSLVATSLGGRPALGMHETVSLDRFVAPWVRFLVPFRMRVEAA